MSWDKDKKAIIKSADMEESMLQEAVDVALEAIERSSIEYDIAYYVKTEFDYKYGPTWHCVVGKDFGSYVTHENKCFVYFYLGKLGVLLFKYG